MKRSSVAGEGGKGVIDEIRTSYGMFIRRLQDPIIERIERRIALYTQLPLSHQEDIQVRRFLGRGRMEVLLSHLSGPHSHSHDEEDDDDPPRSCVTQRARSTVHTTTRPTTMRTPANRTTACARFTFTSAVGV